MSVRLLKFLFPFLQLAINKQNFFHFALNIRGPARPPPPFPCLQLSFTLRFLSTQKLSLDKENERNLLFNSCHEIRIFAQFFLTFALKHSRYSVFCLSQTTTKFVLLTILNHIIFIPYFVNGLGFFSSGIANYFFFSNSAKTN